MKRFFGAVLVTSFLCGTARADDAAATAVLDKAIKALGGQEKLAKAEAVTWKGKGKLTINDNENNISTHATIKGLDHYRGEFEGEFNGNAIKGVTVLAGDKGWRKFGDDANEMDADALANEKRTVYLQVIPITLVALKGKGFQVAAAGEEKAGGTPAVAIKATGPDGKDFTISFDKESGLPVKLVARVMGFRGEEFTQETTFGDYKDMDGIKKATKIESKRDGEKFMAQEITEFKVLDKVDAETFAEPQ